jgi:hypothetical protein
MFMKSAQAWVAPAPNAECHEAEPGEFGALISAWRARWPEFLTQS